MSTDHWERAKELFAQALELPEKQRTAFLVDACRGEDALRREVESLLSGDAAAGSFLERPVAVLSPSETSATSGPAFAPDQTISGRFRVVRFIRRGGMGEVYEAQDLELGERVALKTIRPENAPDERGLARFKKEVQLARKVTHPNVCRIFDLERHVGAPLVGAPDVIFLTMELLEGETLAERLARVGRMTPAEALPIVEQMAAALAAAHDVGVVHRDFKPGNVMLVPSSSGSGSERAVVTDFGLARTVRLNDAAADSSLLASLTETGQIVGTVAYMAPEQLRGGECTPATDVYALGLVMYEMVAGKRPASPPAAVPGLDPKWEATILRCLEIDPAKRFPSTREVGQALVGPTVGPGLAPAKADASRRQTDGPTLLPLRSLLFGTRRRALASVAAILAVALFVALFRVYLVKRYVSQVPAGSLVLLTNVENETSDAELNGVSELLQNQLEQSAYFNLVSPGQIREALERMVKPADQKLDPVTARQVAWRSGAPLVVFGSISSLAQEYTLALRMEKVGSDPNYDQGRWTETWHASNKKEIFDAVRDASRWAREKVGEQAKDVSESDRPPQDVTTDSWEALELFTKAQQLAAGGRPAEAIDVLKEAVQKDTQFASAYMRIGDLYDSLGDYRHGYPNWQKALSISGARQLARREELMVKGVFAIDRTDLKSALEVFNAYRGYYPHDWRGAFFRAYPLLMLGRPEEAIQTLEDAHQSDPTAFLPVYYLPAFNLVLNRFTDAERWNEELRQRPEGEHARYYDAAILFLQNEPEKAREVYHALRSSKDPYYQTRAYYLEASVLAELGETDEAMKVLEDGMEVDLAAGRDVFRAQKLAALSYLALKKGDLSTCRTASLNAVRLDASLPESMLAGSLLARCGFVAEARRVLEARDPGSYPPVSDVVLYRLRGEISLAEGRKEEALADFEKVDALDMPADDREYLARSLVALGHLERAWVFYKTAADLPGLIWQQAEIWPPGIWGDMLCQGAAVSLKLGKPDAQGAASKCKRLRGQEGLPRL